MDDTDGITRVVIEGPGRNLLDPQKMAVLERRLLDADADSSVVGILLTGAGELFCGGLDGGAINAGGDPVEFAGALVRLLKVFPLLSTPIAAVVNGDALASGAAIVAACDYAAATPAARIGTLEVSVGIWPMVAQVPIVHRIGARAAMENIGSGEPFTAARAREVGLINAVVDPEELESTATTWLRNAARGGAATAAGRPTLYELAELPYDIALDRALDRFAAMFDR